MYAIIKTGGKQYRVAENDVVKIEKLEAEPGSSVQFDQVLMVGGTEAGARVGAPMLAGASVTAEVVDQIKGDKVIIFKKKRRQNYRRKRGHRQRLTIVRITGISAA